MGSPYLNRDETIVLATHNILIKTVRSDVILTNQRLIISGSSHAQFLPQTLPLATVMTVMQGEDIQGNPLINLSMAAAHDATEPLEMLFIQKPGEQRKQECDDWVKQITDLAATAREEAAQNGVSIADLVAVITAEKSAPVNQPVPEHKPVPEPQRVPETTTASDTAAESKPAEMSPAPSTPAPSSLRPKIIAVAAIIVIMLVIAGGWYLVPKYLAGHPAEPVVTPVPVETSPTTEITAPPTPAPTPVQIIETTPSPVLTTTPVMTPRFNIPQTGIWVKIDSPVMYRGTIGTSGRLLDINATGVLFRQIPAQQDAVIDISLQKQSSSGETLSVEIYNNGQLVSHGSITKPLGTLELHVDLKSATPVNTTA